MSRGHHRSNVMSQVQEMFPDLDGLLNDDSLGLRNNEGKSNTINDGSSSVPSHRKGMSNEEVLLWRASVVS
jgi:hypothetical protein